MIVSAVGEEHGSDAAGIFVFGSIAAVSPGLVYSGVQREAEVGGDGIGFAGQEGWQSAGDVEFAGSSAPKRLGIGVVEGDEFDVVIFGKFSKEGIFTFEEQGLDALPARESFKMLKCLSDLLFAGQREFAGPTFKVESYASVPIAGFEGEGRELLGKLFSVLFFVAG